MFAWSSPLGVSFVQRAPLVRQRDRPPSLLWLLRCVLQLMGPSTAPAAQQYERRTTPFFDDFSQGLYVVHRMHRGSQGLAWVCVCVRERDGA